MYTHTCIYVCMYTHTDTDAHHIFFIHLSVDGHLGYFHILAIVILGNADLRACVLPILSS